MTGLLTLSSEEENCEIVLWLVWLWGTEVLEEKISAVLVTNLSRLSLSLLLLEDSTIEWPSL